jgi:hypothetical protein
MWLDRWKGASWVHRRRSSSSIAGGSPIVADGVLPFYTPENIYSEDHLQALMELWTGKRGGR